MNINNKRLTFNDIILFKSYSKYKYDQYCTVLIFYFIFLVLFFPHMDFKDIKYLDQQNVNTSLINKHLQEIEDLQKSKSINKEKEFVQLRSKQELESNVYYYYKQLHKKCLEEKNAKRLHGYLPVSEIRLSFKSKTILGTIFVLTPDSQFGVFVDNNNFKLSIKNRLDYFYKILIDAPLPFIFLPDCDLFEFNEFMKEIYGDKTEFQKSMYSVKIDNKEVFFVEPLILAHLNLEFFVNDFIVDENICCLLFGFLDA